MKNIIHIVDSLERGGQESFIVDLAIAQEKSNFNVTICCLFKLGVLADKALENNIAVECLNSSNHSKYKIVSSLKKLLNTYNYDVIHTHNRLPLIMVMLASIFKQRNIINTRHGNGVRGLYWSIAALFCNRIVNVSEALYTNSNFINRSLFKNKNAIIKNGIPIDDKYAKGKNVGKLIIVGRLNEVKNHTLALEIIAGCIKKKLPVTLDIVGEGPTRSYIESKIELLGLSEHVNMLGDRGDVKTLLLESDIFILTSFSEGHSIALLEATAAGLPALATNVGGNPEIVQDGITGKVISLSDTQGFINAIETLIEDRNLRNEMSVAAKNWAIDNASIESCNKKYMQYYYD